MVAAILNFICFVLIDRSQQQGALVHFSLFREKREKHNFCQFSKYVGVLAKMNEICLKLVNSGDFAMILLLEVRKT